jgi:SAM-dependent methyltransferase
MKKLNLGCGADVKKGWINLDSVANPGVDIVQNLDEVPNKPLPFKSNEISFFLLSHLLEHLERPLEVMQELWRVAVPDARMVVRVPHGGNDDAWVDPTHQRPYYPRSFSYFSQPKYYRFDYGYLGDWECQKIYLATPLVRQRSMSKDQALKSIHFERNLCSEMVAILRAVKPARPRDKSLATAPKIVLTESVPHDMGYFENGEIQ